MSGLDKMKAQIIAEAQDNAKEILAQAHAQADSILGHSSRKGIPKSIERTPQKKRKSLFGLSALIID